MVASFLSLNVLRIAGLALSYLVIVFLSRSQGPETLGQYMFLVNSAIVIGTLASLGLPTLVQRLSARLTADTIGVGTCQALRRRWLAMVAISAGGAIAILELDGDATFSVSSVMALALASFAFALSQILTETVRIAYGPQAAEFQRNLLRPALMIALLSIGIGVSLVVPMAMVGTVMLVIWRLRATLRKSVQDVTAISSYVAERSRDLGTVFLLGFVGLLFGSMDVVLIGLITDAGTTGIYGAASRYGMLINVVLLAGNAQMVLHLARLASGFDEDGQSLLALRRLILMIRIASTLLLAATAAMLPLYARIINLPAAELWPYFTVVALSFWLQSIIGPVNMFMLQAHAAKWLIFFHVVGAGAFAVVGAVFYLQGTMLAVPLAVGVGANLVKILAWFWIAKNYGIRL